MQQSIGKAIKEAMNKIESNAQKNVQKQLKMATSTAQDDTISIIKEQQQYESEVAQVEASKCEDLSFREKQQKIVSLFDYIEQKQIYFVNQIMQKQDQIFPFPKMPEEIIEKFKQATKYKEKVFSYRGMKFATLYDQIVNVKINQQNIGKNVMGFLSTRDEFNNFRKIMNTSTASKFIYSMIEDDQIKINGHSIRGNCNYRLKQGDNLSYKVYNGSEPPVYDQKITYERDIEDENLVIINKPASIPNFFQHQIHKNTLHKMLQQELRSKTIYTLQGLEKSISGLVLLYNQSNNTIFDNEKYDQFKNGAIVKKFYARVMGKFPNEEIKFNFINDEDSQNIKYTVKVGDNQEEDFRNKIQNGKYFNVFRSSYLNNYGQQFDQQQQQSNSVTSGNQACNIQFVSYDEETNSSLVDCTIYEGLIRQININLSNFGHPILNDLSATQFDGKNFIGNILFEKNCQDIMTPELRKKYHDEVIRRGTLWFKYNQGQKRFDRILLKFNQKFDWDFYQVFEYMLHAYQYEYKDLTGFNSPNKTFKIDEKPYWYDANELNIQLEQQQEISTEEQQQQ